MSTPDRGVVVAGVDGSLESRAAAQYALDAAAARHLDVLVVHAYQPPWLVAPASSDFTPSMQRLASQQVSETLGGLVVQAQVRIETQIALAPPIELLLAASHGASLVVIGRHRLRLVDRLLTGSVGSAVAVGADCPVVVVPRTWSHRGIGVDPVVVALDGESPATAALSYAFDEAELRQSAVIALHAAPLIPSQSRRDIEGISIGEILAGQKQDHPDVEVTTLLVGEPASERIIEASRSAAAVVVGRPHRHRPLTLWTRSVAHAVLARSECPLIIVPQATSTADTAGSPTPTRVRRNRLGAELS